MRSIEEVGLQEPIDVLEVEGQLYGFSGCHRFEVKWGSGGGVEAFFCQPLFAALQTLFSFF